MHPELPRPVKPWTRAMLLLLAIAGGAASGCLVLSLDPMPPIPAERPVYPEDRVALCFDAQTLSQNVAFVVPARFLPRNSSTQSRYIFAGRAFQNGVSETAKAYFPQTTIYHGPPPPGGYDLQLQAALTAKVETQELDWGMTVEVQLTGSLKILTQTGKLVDQLRVETSGSHRIEDLWVRETTLGGVVTTPSEGDLAVEQNLRELERVAGDQAMVDLLRQVVQFVHNSPALAKHLAALREKRAQPSELLAAVSFEDGRGMLPNQRLDAGETGDLVVQVQNQGPGAAYGVVVAVSAEHTDLELPAPQSLGEIAPGESRTLRLPVRAGLQLVDGTYRLLVETQERRGYHARKALLEVPTVGLVRPALQVSDILLDDRGGKAVGDGDGQPANGETVEATVFVRNTGAGNAGQVRVSVAATAPEVEVLEGSYILEAIPAGELRQVRFLLRLPHTLAARELGLQATAVEGRGERVARGQLARTWPILFRNPDLDVDWRVFDGTSPASAGNRDGRVGNGERIEVLLTPTNRGAVEARDVKLALVSPEAGVVIQPARIDLPNLSPGMQAPPVSVTVDVPRTFQGERLILRANLEQRDFPLRQREIELPVVRSLPAVKVQLSAAPALQQGERRQYQLQIENRGDLEARNVRVQVVPSWPNLDLLGEKNVALGNLLPQATALPLSLELHAKRSAPSGRALLQVTVEQDDFAPAVHEIPFEVAAEAPTHVQVAPEVPREVSGRPGGSDKPVIFFRSYEDGQIVADEQIDLVVEIHDGAGLAHVGATLNGRPLSLPRADASRQRQVNRYRIPIQLDLGPNQIEVTAISFAGGSVSRSLSLAYAVRQSQVWAAVIGVSRYEDPNLRLQYAATDAAAFAAYLRTETGIPADHMLVLENEQAVRRRVIEAIGDWLPERAEVNDTVILYFAGHGARAEDAGSTDGLAKYLLPYDAATTSYNSSAINFEELKRQIARIRAARIIIVLDTCFSGAAAGGRTVFDPQLQSRDVLNDDFLVELTGEGKGTVLLMASGVNELAYEPPDLGHGAFTFYLLEGLRGKADAHPIGNADGRINVDEAFLYVSRKVREKTGSAQNPQKFGGGSGEIFLGRARAGAPK